MTAAFSLNELKAWAKEALQLNETATFSEMIISKAREAEQAKAAFPECVTLENIAKNVADHVDVTFEIDHQNRTVVFRKRDACR